MKIVGISGPSCSGKSTLGRHLRLVLPNAGILYEDDFYLPESKLPLDDHGDPNWDCPKSFDLVRMREALQQTKQSNRLPDQATREDRNNVASTMLTNDQLIELRKRAARLTEPVLLLDGIILYNKEVDIDALLDVKLLVPFDYEVLKNRREVRNTYVTLEGNWVDPPHFFENVVWPEFLKHCGYLYTPDYKHASSEATDLGVRLTLYSDDMYAIISDTLAYLESDQGSNK